MASSIIKRKLAAIMFTDIAGYTEQMSQDEDKAFALIQKKHQRWKKSYLRNSSAIQSLKQL